MHFQKETLSFLAGLVFGFGLINPVFAQDIQTVTPEKVGMSSQRLARIDEMITTYVKDHQIAGAVVMISRRNKTAYFKSYGMQDTESKTPMQKDSIFRLASMTKPIITVAAMILYEEGRFLLDDPVSKYISEFKDPKVLIQEGDGYKLVPAKREITIRNLLSQTSGISYRFLGRKHLVDYYRQAGISDGLSPTQGTIGDEVKRLAKLPLLHQPGEAYEYGLNTDVTGYLIEVISGMPLDRFLKTRLFDPVGMKNTQFYLTHDQQPRLATLYIPDDKNGIKKADSMPTEWGDLIFSPEVPYSPYQTYFSGGAGLTSTASEYMRFLQMLLKGGEINGHRILSRKSIELMTANQIGEAHIFDSLPLTSGKFGTKFGFGVGIQNKVNQFGLGSEGEYTWAGIFSTRFYIDPKEQLITLFMAQRIASKPEIEEKLHVLVNSAIID